MPSPPQPQKQKQQQQQRRHQRRRSKTPIKNEEEDLLSPTDARKNIKDLLMSAIDEVANTLKQIPRARESASSSNSRSPSVTSTSTTNESPFELPTANENDKKPKRFTFGEERQQPKNRKRNEKNGNTTTKNNTIIIQNIQEDAKGITLKFNVKMIKPDGTPKQIDFEVEMLDFEPSFVKIGQKTVFLE